MNALRSLRLIKGEHRYVFRYRTGQEGALLECFVDLASDPRSGFTWLDAALLSFQLEADRGCVDKLPRQARART